MIESGHSNNGATAETVATPSTTLTAEDQAKRIGTFADAVGKPATAIATSAAVLGSIWLAAASSRLPGGFPSLDGSALPVIVGPIALAGVYFLILIAAGTGLAGFAYNGFSFASRRERYVPPFRSSSIVETIFFLTLAVVSMVMLAAVGERHFPQYTIFAIPILGVLAAVIASHAGESGLSRTERWMRYLRLARAGLAWFFPFLLSMTFAQATINEQHATNAALEWCALGAYVLIAAVANYLAAVGGIARSSIFGVLIIVVLVFFAPTAMLLMPLRALGLVDVPMLITVDAMHLAQASSLFQGCKAVRSTGSGSFRVMVLDGIGTDWVVKCTSYDDWKSIRRDWLISRSNPNFVKVGKP